MQSIDELRLITYFIIGALVAFQTLHYAVASWRFFVNSPRRAPLTCAITLYWAVQGAVLLTVVPMVSFNAFALISPALLGPPTVIAMALLSPRFCAVVDRVSLRWAIADVEGPSRIIVGIVFVVWWAFGALPLIFAWIAGPGDVISGVFAYIAMWQLDAVTKHLDVHKRHWSVTDVVQQLPASMPESDLNALRRKVVVAIVLGAVGIADFIAAPASAAVSFILGNPATELAHRPLGFVPMLLVPQVFTLEVLAMRQLHVMRVRLKQLSLQRDAV